MAESPKPTPASVISRLLKEFWIPLLVAAGWTVWNFYTVPNLKIAGLIANFSGALFFTSWLSGHYVRIHNKLGIEGKLLALDRGLDGIASNIEEKVQNLLNHLTGGDSFAHLEMFPRDNDVAQILIVHHGEHPLFDVSFDIADLQASEEAMRSLQNRTNISLAAIPPGQALLTGNVLRLRPPGQDFNVFTSARNGRVVQLWRFRKIDGLWRRAIVVKRMNNDQPPVEIYRVVDEGFPSEDVPSE